MSIDILPVDISISIESASLERDSFYNLCFIAESDIAPRTLEVNKLSDLLDNGYDRFSLAYNFCVGVFSQDGMTSVKIRAKRSNESYEQAYSSDINNDYYFLVIQTKNLDTIKTFSEYINSNDEQKLLFFSSDSNNEFLGKSRLVNYYQDYEIKELVTSDENDFYLQLAYGGDAIINGDVY